MDRELLNKIVAQARRCPEEDIPALFSRWERAHPGITEVVQDAMVLQDRLPTLVRCG